MAAKSEYYATLFQSPLTANPVEIHLDLEWQTAVFPAVVKYMYAGCLKVHRNNCVELYAMADELLMTELRDLAFKFIADTSEEHAFQYLMRSVQIHSIDLVGHCLGMIAPRFSIVRREKDLNLLPFDIFEGLVAHPSLNVSHESEVFDAVLDYCGTHERDLLPEQTKMLFSLVRFAYLESDQLRDALSNDHVPKELVISGLYNRLKITADKHLITATPTDSSPIVSLAPRTPLKRFVFEGEPFDDKGFIYWLGRGCGREADFKNPVRRGLVSLYCDVPNCSQAATDDLLSRTASSNVPLSADFSVRISFLFHRIIPSHYSLRSESAKSWAPSYLRNWMLEASNDGIRWKVLCTHQDEVQLERSPTHSHSWPFEEKGDIAYAHFRIRSLGNNWWAKVQTISGFELYGTLLPEV
eukprot:CAMPEP_0184370486 /NCGR_PEP_ID=MMETSP1089-20130417/162849_1 /TAXON_ID=38269 ORGANISM="Gloeochaete wittrockiana, Strain SAG46.84" /NCGR_SAMPLE_ID=MMETSP1089 /ASSEMBLY_ACC=CAM_ASM_000445 /LENGTH=411 /DNA_ID=CAMNT_0026713099 /DNA_START=192 /DNA_END=1427 /DNA_ORIENTATION=+